MIYEYRQRPGSIVVYPGVGTVGHMKVLVLDVDRIPASQEVSLGRRAPGYSMSWDSHGAGPSELAARVRVAPPSPLGLGSWGMPQTTCGSPVPARGGPPAWR